MAAWLTDGDSICLHDPLGKLGLAGTVRKVGELSEKYRYVGFSDSGVGYNWRLIDTLFDQPTYVVVWRNAKTVIKSIWKFLLEKPYANQQPINQDVLRERVAEVHQNLNDMTTELEDRAVGISFYDLNQMDVCEMLWNKILPGKPFSADRWKLFHELNIQPQSSNITLNQNVLNEMSCQRL